jgi:peptidylprolyl isomerase
VTQLHRAAAVLVALALSVTGCGTAAKKETTSLKDQIEVTGAFGEKPAIRFKAPLKVPDSSSWVAEAGDRDTVGAEATVILQLTLANGRTGKLAISTFDPGQRPLETKLGDQVFASLVEGLVGKPAHTRVVVASTGGDAYGDGGAPQSGIKAGDPVVMVADILSTDPTSVLDGPTGPEASAPATAPVITEKDGVPVGFDFAKAHKPGKLVVIPLREGTGPAVEAPDRVAVDYLVQVWDAAKPLEESYSKDPTLVSIGTGGGVIKAWDQALAGRKEGSRVMIISPPELAYGAAAQPQIPANSTLVFVVDVLGVG